MSFIKRIVPYIVPYKKEATLNIFFNILYSIFSGLSFFVVIPLLRVIFNPEKSSVSEPSYNGIFSLGDFLNDYIVFQASQLAKDNNYHMLLAVISLIICIFLLKNLFSFLAIYNITILKNGVLMDLRNKMFKKITELPVGFYSENKKGDIISRVVGDIFIVQESYLSALQLIIREPLTILFTFVFMLATSVKLTLFSLIFIPVAGLVISKIGKSLKSQSDDVQKEQGQFLSILDETLSGIKIIKGFNAENHFQHKFEVSAKRYLRFINSLDNRINLSSPLSEFLGILIFSVLLLVGGKMVLVDQTFSGEKFLGLLIMAYNILTPAKSISKVSYGIKKGQAAAERVFYVIDYDDNIKNNPNAINKEKLDSEIEFKDVSFKYKENYVINRFNLTIKKGQMVALVGQSGSGKSTIANLISRFYDVNKGKITIDGINVKEMTKESLRNLIGIVTQDSILFNDSVRNNLLLGRKDVTDDAIIQALKIANAWEFVEKLPHGMDTYIGDSGNRLSGGQKQRLSIARAVLKNPPIMVLDEATSALDTESEKLVQDALEKMMENRTSLVIAHRLSTVQNADLIVVIHEGKIVEQGTHNELINQKGTYQKLVDMQQLS